MLPPVASVLPVEKLNETLVRYGLLPCCHFPELYLSIVPFLPFFAANLTIVHYPLSIVRDMATYQPKASSDQPVFNFVGGRVAQQPARLAGFIGPRMTHIARLKRAVNRFQFPQMRVGGQQPLAGVFAPWFQMVSPAHAYARVTTPFSARAQA